MNVEQRQVEGGGVVVDFAGDIDMNSSPAARKVFVRLAKKKVSPVIVNMSEVDYIDSSGVATLIDLLQRLRNYDGELRVFGCRSQTRDVFKIARLDKIFRFFDTEEAALEA